MKILANKKIRESLHPDIRELLESEMIVKLAQTFPGARVTNAERLIHKSKCKTRTDT
jgi:hypothetical protein